MEHGISRTVISDIKEGTEMEYGKAKGLLIMRVEAKIMKVSGKTVSATVRVLIITRVEQWHTKENGMMVNATDKVFRILKMKAFNLKENSETINK